MSNLKKRQWAKKAITQTSIWLGKRENDMYLKCMVLKAKGLLIKLKYQKFQASISKRDVKIKMIKRKEAKWKASISM